MAKALKTGLRLPAAVPTMATWLILLGPAASETTGTMIERRRATPQAEPQPGVASPPCGEDLPGNWPKLALGIVAPADASIRVELDWLALP